MSQLNPNSAGPTPDAAKAQAAQPPKFDRNAQHQQRPKVRSLRGFPLQAKNDKGEVQQLMGLSDQRQISDRVVVTVPAMRVVIPKMDGSRDLDQIVHEVKQGLTRLHLEQFVAQLDEAGLIEGPNFQRMRDTMRAEFDRLDILPPGTTAGFGEQLVAAAAGQQRPPIAQGKPPSWDEHAEEHRNAVRERMRETFGKFVELAEPRMTVKTYESLPRAIMAPHVDYGRGWINYASAWAPMKGLEPPARVIVLGTNHFGEGTGVVGCDKGYVTPLGRSELDTDVKGRFQAALGDTFFEHRYDHEHEHSIELQAAWIHYLFGDGPKIFGVLVHDPAVNNGESYDGRGVALAPFVEALKGIISGPDALPGRTLIVSSADLSHCGPAFGDKQSLQGESPETVTFRNRIVQHDQEMLKLVSANKPAELIAAMAWQQNPTRWCSTGNIVATLMAVEPAEVKMLNYGAAMDPQGTTFVSSVAAAMP